MAKKIRYQNLTDFLLTNYRNINGLYSYINSNGITEFDSFESSSIGSSFKTDEKSTTLISTDGVMPLGQFVGENVTTDIPTLDTPLTFKYKVSRTDSYIDRIGYYAINIKWVQLDITETFSGVLDIDGEIILNSTQTITEDMTIEISGTLTDSFELIIPELELLTPTGTDAYLSGEEFNITWATAENVINVTIDLYYGDGFKSNIATNVPDTGAFTYSFPLDYDFNTGYYIVITKVLGVAQSTSEVFELLPTTLTVTNPTLNAIYTQAQTINITWVDNNSYDTSNVNIYLLSNGVFNSNIALNIVDVNSYSYQLPVDISAGNVYAIKVEKINNTTIFDVSDVFQINALATETINLTLNRAGNISNSLPFPTVFTATVGNGLTNQTNNNLPMFLYNPTPNVYNVRGFFYIDLGSVTNTAVAGKLYMKIGALPEPQPISKYYLYRGTQPFAPSFNQPSNGFVGVDEYDSFAEVLSAKSVVQSGYAVFTLNAAGIAKLTTKGIQGFCIRNEYDVELVNPVGITDYPTLSLINSYFELKY